MIIYTSNFSKSSRDPKAVSICRNPPSWYNGRRYSLLAPPKEIYRVGLSPEQFRSEYYRLVLDRLNVEKVINNLGDGAVLLCFEKASDFCHRQIVAEWINNKTGIVVQEVKSKSDLIKEQHDKKARDTDCIEQLSFL